MKGPVRAQPKGPSVMTNFCRHCGEKIERWSGRGAVWAHGEIGSGDFECLPELVEEHRRVPLADDGSVVDA